MENFTFVKSLPGVMIYEKNMNFLVIPKSSKNLKKKKKMNKSDWAYLKE